MIYGARNHGSRAFCTFLVEHGYSLIIIDNDQGSLNSAEKHVLKDFPDVSIMKVKMEEFDEGEILRIVKQLNKFGEIIRGLVITKNVMLNEQNSKKFEGLNYDEIHTILHDNTEMMVGLINVLIKPIKKAGNGFVINLRNTKYDTEDDAIYWDLLHYSTSKFSRIFVDAVRKTETDKEKGKDKFIKINQEYFLTSLKPKEVILIFRVNFCNIDNKVNLISVSVNYEKIKAEDHKDKLSKNKSTDRMNFYKSNHSQKLCWKTFTYLGV